MTAEQTRKAVVGTIESLDFDHADYTLVTFRVPTDSRWVAGEYTILAALSGEGMVMVPREPTEEMIASGWRGFQGSGRGTTAIWHAYRAMIAASPALTNDKEGV